MWDALQEEWGKIEQEYIDKLYQSMLERVAAVIEANGSHTRYWNNFLNCFWNKGDIETMGGESDNQISNAQYLLSSLSYYTLKMPDNILFTSYT